MRLFHVASDEEIKQGKTTDIYFDRTKRILKAKGLEKTHVVAEVTAGRLPEDWSWSVLCGIEELAYLFENVPVDVHAMPEGTVFHSVDHRGLRVPVVRIEGSYGDFCLFETPLLGLLCQASGISTRAARVRIAAEKKRIISFGIRRMHPAISAMIDRAALIGGFDAVSCLVGGEITETSPVGTMPHALIVVMGDQIKAWRAFDSVLEGDVPRIALVDTYSDEKMESIMAANTLKNLEAVRLDTPSSRKGNFAEIIREVRWELDLRGYRHVKIFISGGLDEESVKELSEAGADAFGIGTYVSNSPIVNFAMDVVETDGRPCAKRGKLGGKKDVWRCKKCLTDRILAYSDTRPECPKCHGETERLLRPLVKNGEIVADLLRPKEIRKYVLKQLSRLSLE